MRTYFVLTGVALLGAALAGGAMLWDGSYYLYCALNSSQPCVANNRWITLFLHSPVIVAASFIQDVDELGFIFGLTYALLPFSLLLISWGIVRTHSKPMFIWAVFGLGFGTLLLQLHFVAEAIISVQLAWPLFLAQFVPGRKTIHLTSAILALLLLICHPFAIGLFTIIGVSAFIVGWKVADLRREKWAWCLVWMLLTGLAVVRLVVASSGYETERLSLAVLQEGAWAVKGPPGWALAGVILAAGLVVSEPFNKDKWNFQWLKMGQLAGIGAATILLLVWAGNPILWNASFAYRILVFIITLPFFALAGVDGMLSRNRPQAITQAMWPWRLRLIQILGLSFALVLGVQSWSWVRLQDRLLTILTESPSPCLSLEEVSSEFGPGQRPFHHWSITTLSLFLQGNVPQKIITELPCDQLDFSVSMPVNGWEVQSWGSNRIFDLRPLQANLRE